MKNYIKIGKHETTADNRQIVSNNELKNSTHNQNFYFIEYLDA